MNLILVALLSLQTPQQPPKGQSFYFSAQFDMVANTVQFFASRATKTEVRRFGDKETTYPPYRWSPTPNGLHLRFLPLSGQGTAPRVSLPSDGLPEPKTRIGFGTAETTQGVAKVDWSRCRPGFYRMEAQLDVKGEDRDWTMVFDHQMFYWRPLSPPKDIYQKHQAYLVTSPKTTQFVLGSRAEGLYGTLLRVESVGKEVQGQIPVMFWAEETTKDIQATLPGGTASMRGLTPVFLDQEAKALRKKYVGKTVYPMGMYLEVVNDSSGTLEYLKRGGGGVRVLDIWRASRPAQLGHVPPCAVGDADYFLTGWFPLYVVVQVDKPADLFQSSKKFDPSTPVILRVADQWAFEREFSSTSKAEEFKNWKPHANGFDHPVFPEVGMTPRQLAWLRSWPAFVGSMKDTLALSEWTFTPRNEPSPTFKFAKGRLLAGPGVVKY